MHSAYADVMAAFDEVEEGPVGATASFTCEGDVTVTMVKATEDNHLNVFVEDPTGNYEFQSTVNEGRYNYALEEGDDETLGRVLDEVLGG